MVCPSPETLQARIDRLEKRLTRTRHAAWLFAALLVVAFTAQCFTSHRTTVKADRYLVTDMADRTRGYFGMLDEEPSLLLFDSYGVKRVEATLVNNGSPRVTLLRDETGSSRLELYVGNDRSEVYLKEGEEEALLTLLNDDERRFVFQNEDGYMPVKLAWKPGESASLEFFDDDGDVYARVPTAEQEKKRGK